MSGKYATGDNYRLVYSGNVMTVVNEVDEAIKEGWRPLGGIALTFITEAEDPKTESKGLFFAQALTR